MKIRWIHISDLHLKENPGVETRLMHRQLPAYLAGLGIYCDYIFCTGDIREYSASYTPKAEAYIRDIAEAVHVSPDCLFMVPGNHDVNVRAGGSFFSDGKEILKRDDVIGRLTDWHRDYYDPKEGVISGEDMEILSAGRDDFAEFAGRVCSGWRGAERGKPHFVIRTKHLNILHVDSSLTYGSRSKTDFVIGTGLLMDELEQLDQSKPTVLLTHYSFDFLSQAERNEVEQLLYHYNVQLWIAGHEHENLCRRQRDKFYEFQCGNMELQKGAKSCFLLGELDLKTGDGTVAVHAWYPQSGWALYPFARKNSEDDTIFPFTLRLPGSKKPETGVSPVLQAAREAFLMLGEQGGNFWGLQLNTGILPDLECRMTVYRNHSFEKEEDVRAEEPKLPLQGVLKAMWEGKEDDPAVSCNGLLLGDGGMGKSTMMYDECRRKLYKENIPAVFISLQNLEGAGESLWRFVLRCLYNGIDQGAENKMVRLVSVRHKRPDLTLFIDGFNELGKEASYQYIKEIRKFAALSGVQLVISSRLDFLRDFGLSHFWMIRTCDLREEQIRDLFADNNRQWQNILARKDLRILLRNPMMALLYANTCPVMEQYQHQEYFKWRLPVKNASDLLYDYYAAQTALFMERNKGSDYRDVFCCMVVISHILPKLAYAAAKDNVTFWPEAVFEERLEQAVREASAVIMASMPLVLGRIKRKYGRGMERLTGDNIYTLMMDSLCLMRGGQGRISFTHQIYRDYLAAVYLYGCLGDESRICLWHKDQIPGGIVYYLQYMADENFWGKDGMADTLLNPYRGVDAPEGDHLVANVLNCWLTAEYPGRRNLTGLDLRALPLAGHLKRSFNGTIDLDHGKVSRKTFMDEKRHDRIVGLRFSHDCRILAAISANGIVSITNIITQSQMIVGQMGAAAGRSDSRIGFDKEDHLVLKTPDRVFVWPTISFDSIAEKPESGIVSIPVEKEALPAIRRLKQKLADSELMGSAAEASENGGLLAVGFDSGHIQVWDVPRQDCIAYLSLGDGRIATASFTKDGKVAALGSGGSLVQIMDIVSGRCIRTLHFDKRISKVGFPGEDIRHPDSAMYLECRYSDGSFHRINLDTMSDTKIAVKGGRLVSDALLRRIKDMRCRSIRTAPNGNAIVLDTESGNAYTWDQNLKELSLCPGHGGKVSAIAICADADSRFAASYSGERYQPGRGASKRDRELSGKILVRVRIVRTGQCQWRLPTDGRKIDRLQFFTSNRIILAAFAANGDILMWELINKLVYGREQGHWERLALIKNNQGHPVDCTVSADQKSFISAYDDGTITIRPFRGDTRERKISTFPGIDLSRIQWETLDGDAKTLETLRRYRKA